ncbi:MAG TPA: hypothetical protein VF516_12420 [Kofleriaceae bacterium]
MKLTAYQIEGPYQEWENVAAWSLRGPVVTIRFEPGTVEPPIAEYRLTRRVIGLADDGPPRPAYASRSVPTYERPHPRTDPRPARREPDDDFRWPAPPIRRERHRGRQQT